MFFLFLWIVLVFNTHGLSAYSVARVLHVSVTEYANDVLTTYIHSTNYVDCAKVCKTDSISFTYDHETNECKIFSKLICQNDNAPKSSRVLMFAMLGLETNHYAVDCSELNPAVHCSGIYRVTPTPGVSFDVYCDMDTANGPMTNGEEEFYRPRTEYKNGFGDLRGNVWLGNDTIHHLTVRESILPIELFTWLGDSGYATYSTIRVGNETENYRLTVSGFSDDCMTYHNGMLFPTYDRDNDLAAESCAVAYKGGWWYNSCYRTNINGGDYMSGHGNTKSLVWDLFYPGIRFTHMKTTRMLVKRLRQMN